MPLAVGDAIAQVISALCHGRRVSPSAAPGGGPFRLRQVCSTDGPAFFVNTTKVRDGKIRVFDESEVTTDVILASACLPTMFQAIEIYDARSGRVEAFWDGGYTGNPALYPLFDPAFPEDIVIVNINPLERDEVPKTPRAIENRMNEISFNSSLLRELRAIGFVQRLLVDGTLAPGQMRDVKIHMIADDDLMRSLSAVTKLLPQPYIMAQLRAAGYRATDAFLERHRGDLGQRSTVDLAEMFS